VYAIQLAACITLYCEAIMKNVTVVDVLEKARGKAVPSLQLASSFFNVVANRLRTTVVLQRSARNRAVALEWIIRLGMQLRRSLLTHSHT
jgi:RasGEF domain